MDLGMKYREDQKEQWEKWGKGSSVPGWSGGGLMPGEGAGGGATVERVNEIVNSRISSVVDGAPSSMDTFKEVSDRFSADAAASQALNDRVTALENNPGGGPIDSALSETSTNAVQNKVIKSAITGVETQIGNIEVLLATI